MGLNAKPNDLYPEQVNRQPFVLLLLLSTLIARDREQFLDGATASLNTASIPGEAHSRFNHLSICPGIGFPCSSRSTWCSHRGPSDASTRKMSASIIPKRTSLLCMAGIVGQMTGQAQSPIWGGLSAHRRPRFIIRSRLTLPPAASIIRDSPDLG
jgi:hypothetical protein